MSLQQFCQACSSSTRVASSSKHALGIASTPEVWLQHPTSTRGLHRRGTLKYPQPTGIEHELGSLRPKFRRFFLPYSVLNPRCNSTAQPLIGRCSLLHGRAQQEISEVVLDPVSPGECEDG